MHMHISVYPSVQQSAVLKLGHTWRQRHAAGRGEVSALSQQAVVELQGPGCADLKGFMVDLWGFDDLWRFVVIYVDFVIFRDLNLK